MIKFSFLLLILRVIQNAESKYELFYSAFIDNNFNNEGWHIENNRSNLIFTICDNQTLFGGYNTFAINTLITYNSSLPPHYKIKISFKFWKIDSWNDEWLYIFIDDQIIQQKFAMREGYPICGVFDADSLEKEVLYEVEMIHTNKFIFNIITSNLDQEGNNESWGIHEFKIEILQCPKGCIYCFDDLSPCDFWINIKSILQTPSQFDEWKREDNTTISSSICAGLNITGGEHILGVNQTVQNIIINFPPHFQAIIEFKLWLFGNWPNDTFILKLDDYQLLEVPLKNQTGPLINCGGTKQNVAFINLRAQTDHSQESMKITFATKSNSSNIKYWGINAFDAYIAKCSNNCQICLGPGQKQCIACIKDWVLFKGDCIYFDKIPPLTCVSTKIIQKVKPISNNINQIQFQSDLMAQKSLKLGENEIEFDQTIPTLNFEIQARCLQNLKIQNSIKIFIRQSDQQQYMFTRGCQDSSPGFIFQINLQQKFEQIKQFIQCKLFLNKKDVRFQIKLSILNLSETSVELYQLQFINTRNYVLFYLAIVILDYQETKILTFSVNFTSI